MSEAEGSPDLSEGSDEQASSAASEPSPNSQDDRPDLDRFPVFVAVLETYFPDRSLDLLARYHQYGEESSEFQGLDDELADAVAHPRTSIPVVNHVLGSDFTPTDGRKVLAELRDQLLQRGQFSAENLAEETARQEQAADREDEAREIIDEAYKRPVAIPLGRLRNHPIQLRWMFLGGAALIIIASFLLYIPWPSWLLWIPWAPMGVGIAAVFFSGVAMTGLRAEIRERRDAIANGLAPDEEPPKKTLRDRMRNMLS